MSHAPERIVEIANEPFGAGFDVRVVPPVSGEHLDAEFQDYRKARRWATGLRINHGWRIRDRTGLADASPASVAAIPQAPSLERST